MTSVSDPVLAVSEMIEAHVRHLRASGASKNTIRDRKRLLVALHEDLPFGLAYASTDELDDWLGRGGAAGHDWKAWTLATYGRHIRGFYAWADGRWLQGDPSSGMAKQKNPDGIPRPVTTDELRHAIDRAPDPWLTAIHLAAYGGLRASELCGVRRQDVTEERIWIRTAKGGDPAAVDTHPDVWALVKDRPPGPLAIRTSGRPITAKWLSDNARKFFSSIGLDGVTMHRFRHWFGTTLLDEGADLRTVQESLRHKSITSTQGYTKVAGGQRRLAIRSLPTTTRRPSEH